MTLACTKRGDRRPGVQKVFLAEFQAQGLWGLGALFHAGHQRGFRL